MIVASLFAGFSHSPFGPGPAFGAFAALFVGVWLGAWTLAGGFVSYILLKMTIGTDTIRIGDRRLTTETDILGYGPKREYVLSEVKRLRANSRATRHMSGDTMTQSGYTSFQTSIAFDYGARTVRICTGLDPAEGRQIVERVGERFPGLAE